MKYNIFYIKIHKPNQKHNLQNYKIYKLFLTNTQTSIKLWNIKYILIIWPHFEQLWNFEFRMSICGISKFQ